MGIFQVGVIPGGSFPVGNCPSGSYPGQESSEWELSWLGIFRVGIVQVGVILGENFLWWGFSAWELSGWQFSGWEFSQYPFSNNDVVAITQRNVKLHVIVIPIFNVVLISDKDENVINNGKHFVLFYFRSIRPEVFCKKSVLRNFTKFIGKYLCQSLLFRTLTQVFSCEFCKILKNE